MWKSTARQNKAHTIYCHKHLKKSEQNARDNINSNMPEQSRLHYVQTHTKQQTEHMQRQKDQEMDMVIPVHQYISDQYGIGT